MAPHEPRRHAVHGDQTWILVCTGGYCTYMSRHKSRSSTRVESVISSSSCRLGPGRTVGRFVSIRNNLFWQGSVPPVRRSVVIPAVDVLFEGGGAGPGRARKAGQPSLWPSTRSSWATIIRPVVVQKKARNRTRIPSPIHHHASWVRDAGPVPRSSEVPENLAGNLVGFSSVPTWTVATGSVKS